MPPRTPKPKAPPVPKAESLGSMINRLCSIRERKREEEEKLKTIQGEYDELELKILSAMEVEGVVQSSGGQATASVSVLSRPQVDDWDEFYKFIQKHKAWHLLERRPSGSGCNELFDKGKVVPGVSKRTFRRLNLRTINQKD